jgi:hypothetical protein
MMTWPTVHRLFHLAHLSENASGMIHCVTANMHSRGARRKPGQSYRQQSIMPSEVSRSKESSVRKGESEQMLPPPKMRDWARHLLAGETGAAVPPLQTGSQTILVYQKLRQGLCPLVGADGFQMLATRALMLAKSNVSRLGTAQITRGGELCGFGGLDPQTDLDKDEDGEAGVIFIAHLFGLFLALLGPVTTQQLVQNVFPCVDVAPEPGLSNPFENMLREVNQLRSVSERLATIADEHPDVGDGLVGISGNISDIATILDVFTVIKRRSEEPHEGELGVQETCYLM